MNKEIALFTPIWFWVLMIVVSIISLATLGSISFWGQFIEVFKMSFLWFFWTVWPNFVRAALYSEDAVLIKDKYFYLSILIWLFLVSLFVVGLIVPIEEDYFRNSIPALIAMVIIVGSLYGLYSSCYRLFMVYIDKHNRPAGGSKFKALLAFFYFPIGMFFIHRGLLRYRAKMGWSNETKIPESKSNKRLHQRL